MEIRGDKGAPLQFAEEWNLDTVPKRRALARRFVTVDVAAKEPAQRAFFAKAPSERLSALKRARKNRLKVLENAVRRLSSIEVVPTPQGLRCRLRVSDLDELRALPGVGDIRVRRVEGVRRSAPALQDEWFAVRGRVMTQIEGQKKGLQKYEDRILLVRARTYRDAERRALREFEEYAKTLYLNGAGRIVRSKLERIIDVYETDLAELNPKGTEVWSSLHSRRMRTEFEWHPFTGPS
jgi:hypothetical protein